MRTNIVIDDNIMKKALLLSGFKTKKEVVEKALQEFVAAYSRKNLFDLKGQIEFSDGYDYKSLRKR
jgi:Arc/MetJ family transcription regulator